VLQLFQTEWCPSSRRVRQRLTELGVDYVSKQVPADPAKRSELVAATGTDSVPALVPDDSAALVGEEQILEYLDRRYAESAGAWAHRARAEKARRRYLREECECPEPRTRSATSRLVSSTKP
jgi:glutathione S-transferase